MRIKTQHITQFNSSYSNTVDPAANVMLYVSRARDDEKKASERIDFNELCCPSLD